MSAARVFSRPSTSRPRSGSRPAPGPRSGSSPAVGDFLVSGAKLAAGTGPAPDAAKLRGLVRVGLLRTLEQDPAYGIRLLVDIALRALSPAVNDPTSAVQALDQLDDALQRLARRSLGDGRLHAGDGRVLVRFPAPRWDAFVALAVDEIIVYGAGQHPGDAATAGGPRRPAGQRAAEQAPARQRPYRHAPAGGPQRAGRRDGRGRGDGAGPSGHRLTAKRGLGTARQGGRSPVRRRDHPPA